MPDIDLDRPIFELETGKLYKVISENKIFYTVAEKFSTGKIVVTEKEKVEEIHNFNSKLQTLIHPIDWIRYQWIKNDTGTVLSEIVSSIPGGQLIGKGIDIINTFIGGKSVMTQEVGFLDSVKGQLVTFIVRWIMKVGSGVLGAHGISEGSVTEIVGALIMLLIGVVMSFFGQKKAINTDPKSL